MAGVRIKYGTSSTGVELFWTEYAPVGSPGQKFPFVIGLHAGGYKSGDAFLTAQGDDCSSAGLYFCGTEYRLAPPSKQMNTSNPIQPAGFQQGNHDPIGQDTFSDHGYAPSQTTDVVTAILAARAHASCNGQVYGLGGSAGGSHCLFNLLTATGDDRFDLIVACSPGVWDLYQSQIWAIPSPGDETYPAGAIANYLNIANTFPIPPAGADLTTAKNASPSFFFDATKIGGKSWVMASNRDSAGIPTSIGYAMESWKKNGSGPLYNETAISQGFIATCITAGMSASTATTPEAGKYKSSIVDTGTQGVNHAHAFNYWRLKLDPATSNQTVADAVITWFLGGAVVAGGAPTITSFTPTSGFAGITPVVITGTNFNSAQAVRFNGVNALSFVVNSNTQITAISPITAATGIISVKNPTGIANSATVYTIVVQVVEDVTPPRTPILVYPVGGLPPTPPAAPTPPRSLLISLSGNPGDHTATASWETPEDTSGTPLLDYSGTLTGSTGVVPDIPGTTMSCILSDLVAETDYTFELQANTLYGRSEAGGAVVTFQSNPASSPTQKDQPRGCLTLFKSSPVGSGNQLFRVAELAALGYVFWANAAVDGSRYRPTWANIQPTDKDTFDWSAMDEYMALCNANNKIAGISVDAGIHSPTWLADQPGVVMFEEHGPDAGIMPIPWNKRYIEIWADFLGAMGDRYDADPMLRYIVLGGLGQVIETYVVASAEDVAALTLIAQADGYETIVDGWLYAAQRILQRASQKFKHTKILLSLSNVVPNNTAGKNGEDAMIAITDWARINIPQFGLMNAGLNGGSGTGYLPNELIWAYSSATFAAGFQYGHVSTDDRSDPTQTPPIDPELAFRNCNTAGSTTLKGKFLEMYMPDALTTDPTYLADIITAQALLAANP